MSDSVTIMMGTATSQVINLVAAPLLARLYSPSAYGEAALILSIISFFAVVACGRYDLSIMLPTADYEAFKILLVALILSIGVSLFAGLGYYLYGIASNKPSGNYLLAIFMGVLLSGFDLGLSSWTLRRRSFRILSFSRASSGLSTVLAQITLGLLGYTRPINLLIGIISGYVVSVTILSSNLLKTWIQNPGFKQVDITSLLKVAKRYRKFPLVEAWGALLNSGSVQLPIFVLSGLFSDAIVGYYSMAFRLIAAPLTLIARAVSQVFFQRASELRRNGEGLYLFSLKIYRRLVIIGLFIFLPVMLYGQFLFSIFLGEQWASAGLFAQYLSPGLVVQLGFAPLSFLFIVLEKQYSALLVHFLIFLFPLLGLFMGNYLANGNANLTIFALGFSKVVLYATLSIWALKILKSRYIVEIVS